MNFIKLKDTFFVLTFLTLISVIELSAQSRPYEFKISKTSNAIELDGRLDDDAWKEAQQIEGFVQNFPNEGEPASESTSVKMCYDDEFVYIAFQCQNSSGNYVVSSLRRDYQIRNNDNVAVYFNPLNDEINGLAFAVNPYNVQWEGSLFGGSWLSNVWDNKWYCKTEQYEDHWVAEMAIPFKTLRYNEGKDFWKINFSRRDMSHNEVTSWVPVPINFNVSHLAFTGKMYWDHALEKSGSNISIIPYVSAGIGKNYEENANPESVFRVGTDAKLAVTSSLNLDLTIYPDFSQVEADQQQTNLQRFELFFPERRQFFLENSDLFSNFGFSRIRPFFSRRIGLANDTSGNLVENRIIAGARLSGNINSRWRVGMMDVQTENDAQLGVPSRNYGVLALEKRVFERSSIGMIFVNRHDFLDQVEQDSSIDLQSYNRVLGFDYNLRSNNNKWMGKAFVHKSFTPGVNDKDFAHAVWLRYNTRRWTVDYNHEYVGENYNAEVGFVPRSDYIRLQPEIRYRIYPKQGAVNVHNIELENNWYFDPQFNLIDAENRLFYRVQFKNTASLVFGVRRVYVLLRDDFDPTGTDGEVLPAGNDYTYYRSGLRYTSDDRKSFRYSLTAWTGGYFNGNRHFFNANLRYRFQPYGNLSLNFEYNKLEFPEPYQNTDLFLIGPRLDISFTDKLFWNTFVQFNSQADNMNINSRFQWRFKPVSDLFLVYTDNYDPNGWLVKNRAVFLKVTYWLNL